VIIFSLIVVTVQNFLEMTAIETRAFNTIKKVELKNKLREEAANVIGKASKLFLALKSKQRVSTTNIYSLKKNMNAFKAAKMYLLDFI